MQVDREPDYRNEKAGVSLYLGDCLEVMPELDDASVDMIFTDPPYGHNNNNRGDLISRREAALGRGGYKAEENDRPIANDGAEAVEVFEAMVREAARVLKPGSCCCCCCGGGGPDPQFARWSLILDEHLQFCQQVIWDKGPIGMGWRYRRSYETVLVAYKKGDKMRWETDSKKVENILRPSPKWPKIIPSENDHPTPKPPGLAEFFLELHSKPGDMVLDPFLGGGSTGVAAVRGKRRFIGIELDDRWLRMSTKKIDTERKKAKLF